MDFARQGKTVVHTLRAKHPRAHEVSPVEITLTGNGPLTPDLAQAVRRSLGFGLPEEVVLPRGAVESLTVSGPEWLSGEHRDVEVRWQPADKVPMAETAVEVAFFDGEHVTACYPGTLAHVGRGSVGRSVRVDLAGGSLELMIPAASGAAASLRFTFSLEKLEPAAGLRLLRIYERIAAGGASRSGRAPGSSAAANCRRAPRPRARRRPGCAATSRIWRRCSATASSTFPFLTNSPLPTGSPCGWRACSFRGTAWPPRSCARPASP
ncbi:hypothetical protein GCM10010250_65880 [Streptomyces althioticus]|nr:hypothetical protein GCM10010250_65880 [Streptomyces althioticus]